MINVLRQLSIIS